MKTERLAGIDWMRGIAAFGVICIHSGLTVHNRTSPAADHLREIFTFAVPFFLVTSFFFALRAERTHRLPWRDWWRIRAGRLLVPFVFWSCLYLALHLGKLVLHHQLPEIKTLFLDPAGLLLGGGTSIALYFLPLLLIGLLVVRLLPQPFHHMPLWMLLLGLFAMLALHLFVPNFDLAPAVLPPLKEAPLRLALGVVEEAVRCAPLIFLAALLVRDLPASQARNRWIFLLAGLLLVLISYLPSLPNALAEIITAFGSFLIAWGLCGFLADGKTASLIGAFAFGIYLVHQVFLELLQLLLPTGTTLGVIGTLLVTIAAFTASLLCVAAANTGPPILRKIFGLK